MIAWRPGDYVLLRDFAGMEHRTTLVQRCEPERAADWIVHPHWPDGPGAIGALDQWIVRRLTPEEIARVQLDQLGQEDAL